MDVPSFICLVRPAAAAKMVRLSAPAPPVVIHAAGMPAWSLRSILPRISSAFLPLTATPISLSLILLTLLLAVISATILILG